MDEQQTPKVCGEGQLQAYAQSYGQQLDILVERWAGELEKKAAQMRQLRGALPKEPTKEQFFAFTALITRQ